MSFYCAKIIMDIIQTIIFAIIFGIIVYLSTGQLYEYHRLFGYVMVIVLVFLCAEGWGQNMAIVFTSSDILCFAFALATHSTMAMLMNFYIKIDDLPLIMQYMSDFIVYPRLYYDTARIYIYGLGRCPPTEKPVVLVKFNITDEQLMPLLYKFILHAILAKFFVLMLLYIKNCESLTKINFIKRKNNIKCDENDNLKIDGQIVVRKLSNIINNLNNYDPVGIESETDRSHSICFAFRDLTLKIPKTFFKKENVIIDKINGFFEFCSINALMGPSGAGKTSLLKTINGLNAKFITKDSKIYLSKYRTIKSCFVTQDERDHIMTGITAGEAMTYASKLKNFRQSLDHKKIVEDLMKDLMIFNTFDTLVDKCSGGEQKRLVIAMELTARSNKPNLICIDEPTSGLDSYTAQVVNNLLFLLLQNNYFYFF